MKIMKQLPLQLVNASNGSISDATATLTITRMMHTPSLSINDVSTTNESNTCNEYDSNIYLLHHQNSDS